MACRLTVELIAEELENQIARGDYPTGTFLPPERQLAKIFKCSRSSISKALSNLENRKLIDRTPGRGTRVLPPEAKGLPGKIGLVHASDPGPYHGLLLQGIVDILSKFKYRYESVNFEESVTDFNYYHQNYCGVIFADVAKYKKLILTMQKNGYPYVVANLESDLEINSTYANHALSTYNAVKILNSLGHQRIVLFRGPTSYIYEQAKEGYIQAIEQLKLKKYCNTIISTPSLGVLSAYKAMLEFIKGDFSCTGIVAARDWIAHGICEALIDNNLKVGRDISVIGFDNLSWKHPNPYLTTFAEPMYEMGAEAAKMLAERLISGKTDIEVRELKSPLILRSSIGPPPDENGHHPPDEDLMLSIID